MKFFIKIVLPAILITTSSLKSMEKVSSEEISSEVVDYSHYKTIGTKIPIHLAILSQNDQKALIELWDNTAFLLDIGTGNKLHNLVGQREILAAALSEDTKTALTGGCDQKVIVWALEKGKQAAKKNREISYEEAISSIALNNHTNTAFIALLNRKIYLLDLEKGASSLLTKYEGNIVALSQNGQTIMIIDGNKISLWSLKEKKELKTFTIKTTILSAALSPDGTQALIGSSDGAVNLWDLTKEEDQFQELIKPGNNCINSVAFGCNGDFIALSTSRKSITLLKPKTAVPLAQHQVEAEAANSDDTIEPKGECSVQ